MTADSASLAGRTALITGCNRGIGRSIAEELAREGADLVAHARRPSDEFIRDMTDLAGRYSVQVDPVFFELTDREETKNTLQSTFREGARVDVLVNNAGVAHGGLFQMTPIDRVREVFDVNFFAQLELMQLVLRRMIRGGSGSIINVASIAGLDLHAGNIAYGASKAALIGATRTVAAEVAALGVRVNAVAPGLTDTDMASEMEDRAGQRMIEDSAMKRVAHADEIAKVVSFLASDAASFINGQVIRIDGGTA